MVGEEIMFAYETLQQSRRLLGLTPCITTQKPRTFFGVKCSKLPDSTGLTQFVDIPETGDISIMLEDLSRPVQSAAVSNLVRFSLNPVSTHSPSIESEFCSVETVNVRDELKVWYTHIWEDVKRKLQLVLLENGTQFTYQTAKLVFEFLYPNLMDARYASSVLMFRLQSAVSIFSIALSVNSIFTPVLNRECILSCIKNKRVPNPMLYVIKCIQLILHLALSTGSVLLLGSISYFRKTLSNY